GGGGSVGRGGGLVAGGGGLAAAGGVEVGAEDLGALVVEVLEALAGLGDADVGLGGQALGRLGVAGEVGGERLGADQADVGLGVVLGRLQRRLVGGAAGHEDLQHRRRVEVGLHQPGLLGGDDQLGDGLQRRL